MKCTNKKCGVELHADAVYCHICGKKQQSEAVKKLRRAKGTGTVYKLSGRRRKPWAAAKDGIIIGYYETKAEGQDAISKFAGRTVPERLGAAFSDVYEEWKTEHFRDLTRKGVEGYENAYKQFATLHNRKMSELRTADFQSVIDSLIALGRSRSTTGKAKALVMQMSRWAMREEIITTNFAQFVKLQPGKRKEKPTFSKEDIGKLTDASAIDETARIILMLIHTGMRIGELFSMSKQDVHGNYCIGGEKTEAGRNRVIPIPAVVRPHFEYFMQLVADGPLLLSGYAGDRNVNNFRRRCYYPLLDKLGIDRKSPHCTRHTFASRAVAAGVKPEHLQKILGHTDYSVTAEVYVHADAAELIRAVESMSSKPEKG
jgi:integrase